MVKDTQGRLKFPRKKREKKGNTLPSVRNRAPVRKNSRYSPPLSAMFLVSPGYKPIHENETFLKHLGAIDQKLRAAVLKHRITTAAHFETFVKGWKS